MNAVKGGKMFDTFRDVSKSCLCNPAAPIRGANKTHKLLSSLRSNVKVKGVKSGEMSNTFSNVPEPFISDSAAPIRKATEMKTTRSRLPL